MLEHGRFIAKVEQMGPDGLPEAFNGTGKFSLAKFIKWAKESGVANRTGMHTTDNTLQRARAAVRL